MSRKMTNPRKLMFDIIYLVREIFISEKAIEERLKALETFKKV